MKDRQTFDLNEKIKKLLILRNMKPSQLTKTAGLSRPTMSRIMKGNQRLSEGALEKIANVLEVTPGYLRGGYTMPSHLTEEDILFLADLRNAPYLELVADVARRGLSVEDLRKLLDILITVKDE